MNPAPPLEILHAGHRYVVINKPAGIGVEAHYDKDTVAARARVQWKRPGASKDPYVGIVHRLDRPVSGCLLLARNKSTLRLLNQAFAEKRVKKTYHAVTSRALPREAGTLRHYLGRDAFGRRAVASTRPVPDHKESVLHYTLEEELPGGRFRYRIEPVTGRYHQIRVQLATAGAPIVGDGLYGSTEVVGAHRILLHASGVEFPEPGGVGRVGVSSGLPLGFLGG